MPEKNPKDSIVLSQKSRRAFVIFNPTSGGGGAKRLQPRLLRELQLQLGFYETAETTEPGEARALAKKAAQSGYALIVACGGDGTIHEVANGLADASGTTEKRGTAPILGIISTGTGGDLAKTLKMPKDPFEQIRVLSNGATRRIDLGRVEYMNPQGKKESRVFVNIADAGLGARVAERVCRLRRFFGRKLAYLSATLESYLLWKPSRVTIVAETNGNRMETSCQCLSVVIANGRYFGGGMPIAPEADVSDSLFDVVVIEKLNPFLAAAAVPLLYAKRLTWLPQVSSYKAQKITLTAEGAVGLDIDGEPIGSLPATFEVIPQALEVRCP